MRDVYAIRFTEKKDQTFIIDVDWRNPEKTVIVDGKETDLKTRNVQGFPDLLDRLFRKKLDLQMLTHEIHIGKLLEESDKIRIRLLINAAVDSASLEDIHHALVKIMSKGIVWEKYDSLDFLLKVVDRQPMDDEKKDTVKVLLGSFRNEILEALKLGPFSQASGYESNS